MSSLPRNIGGSMTEFDNSNENALTPEHREYLYILQENLAHAIEACHEPLDAKVLGLLEIAYDIIDQQLKLDIFHQWGPGMELGQIISNKSDGQKFLFLDNENTDAPSAEDLRKWFGD